MKQHLSHWILAAGLALVGARLQGAQPAAPSHHAQVLNTYREILGPYFVDHEKPRGENFIPPETLLPLLEPYLTNTAKPYYEKILGGLYAPRPLKIFEQRVERHPSSRTHMIEVANKAGLCLLADVIESREMHPDIESRTRFQMEKLYIQFYNDGHLKILEQARNEALAEADQVFEDDPEDDRFEALHDEGDLYLALKDFPQEYVPAYLSNL